MPGSDGALVVAMLQHPRLRCWQELLGRRHELVDEAALDGFLRRTPLPLQQPIRERGLQSEHPDHSGHPATTGQDTQRHLGESEFDRVVVDGNPVMTGQRDLQAAAERRPVERRDHRTSEPFQGAQLGLHAFDQLVDPRGVGPGRVEDQRKVGAGDEGLLRAGENDPGHPGEIVSSISVQTLEGHRHRSEVGVVHRVHGRVGIVQRDDDNAVVVAVVADHVLLVDHEDAVSRWSGADGGPLRRMA